ncbi:MAG: hypothetical protein LBG83_09430 [Oscillospiraceae bacterium]|jgi:hypothetical protein|nr:hypothetical protein [Oscillospiraceae bacterium]
MVLAQILQDLFTTFGIPAVTADPFINFIKGIASFFQSFKDYFAAWKDLTETLGSL